MQLLAPEPRLGLADWADADRLFQARREEIVPVLEPMVLISQVQRCGGTLLSALLDGHPQLHVHPWEIQIGHPSKAEWPRLDLAADIEAWFETLDQRWVRPVYETGYRKDAPADEWVAGSPSLNIVPSFVRGLFRVLTSSEPPETQRAILDRYFTAFFNAWLDCQGLREGPKRWLAGFCPRLAWGESRSRWRRDYPDGRLVTILRDPRGWYASARLHNERYRDPEAAVELWLHGAEEIRAAQREEPEQVIILTYESLVMNPEAVMRTLASWLEIDWADSLVVPTLNRRPVPPDSSFDLPTGGVRTESREKWREELSRAERSRIEESALPLYDAVAQRAAA